MVLVPVLVVLWLLAWIGSFLTWWGAVLVGALIGVPLAWWATLSPPGAPGHGVRRPHPGIVLSSGLIFALVMAGGSAVGAAQRAEHAGGAQGGGAAVPTPAETRDAALEEYTLHDLCIDGVKARISTPSSADFGDHVVRRPGENTLVEGGDVDFENLFGAKIRHTYACAAHVLDGTVYLDAVDIS